MLPVNQMGSIATFAAQLGSGTGAQPFKTVKDYDNWLARGDRLPLLSTASSATCAKACRPAWCNRGR